MGRWLVRILGGLAMLALIIVGFIYVQSNRIINKRYAFTPYAITAPTDSASIAQGRRLAQVRCFGCHGDSLQGRNFFDEPMIARIVAPDVPAKLATMTDAEFAGFLRSGVRKDGTSPFVMPPPGFYHISDADLGALLGYLRSLPVNSNTTFPGNSYRPLGRLGVLLGQFKTAVATYDTTQERVGQDPAWATARHGEYLARLICTECHGMRLTGDSLAAGGESPSPSLAGAAGYTPEQFVTLMRTGTPREPTRKLGLMAETARGSLTHLTDDEIAAIYGYLRALPLSGVAK